MSSPQNLSRPWPEPQATWGASLQSALPWGGGLVLALLVLALGLWQWQQTVQVQLRDARLTVALQDIQDRLEADLALGFELGDNARAQALLEDALAHDAGLRAAEIFDTRGISLFNTDRGAVGEPVPAAWLAVRDGRWSVHEGTETTVGLALRGAFGEVAGQVCLTAALPPAPSLLPLLGGWLVCVLLLLPLAVVLARRRLQAELTCLDPAAMDAAARRLLLTEAQQQAVLHRLLDDQAPLQLETAVERLPSSREPHGPFPSLPGQPSPAG